MLTDKNTIPPPPPPTKTSTLMPEGQSVESANLPITMPNKFQNLSQAEDEINDARVVRDSIVSHGQVVGGAWTGYKSPTKILPTTSQSCIHPPTHRSTHPPAALHSTRSPTPSPTQPRSIDRVWSIIDDVNWRYNGEFNIMMSFLVFCTWYLWWWRR